MILTACLVALQSVSPVPSSFVPAQPAPLELELEAVREARASGLAWLAAQQLQDGSWEVREGEQVHHVGVTALALRALQAAGNEADVGPHARVMQRGLRWLREQQDPDSGSIGEVISHSHAYDHAIATLVLVEALGEGSTDTQRASATRAIGYVIRSRNPYGAWRYDSPPIGDNDTSVTSWMVRALAAARDHELEIDTAAFQGASSWVNDVTDAGNGRIGYDTRGSMSSRTVKNESYPRESGEAMTAAGIGILFHSDAWDSEAPLAKKQQQLLLQNLPEWEPKTHAVDMYYWYQAAHSLSRIEGPIWRQWAPVLGEVVIDAQRTDEDFDGSWDPVGPWGYSGGRVYSTALMSLALQKLLDSPSWRTF